VKPCLLKIVKLDLRECSKAKMKRMSYSSNTIQRHILEMWEDVKDQVINEMEASSMFFNGWFNRCYFLCSIACFHEIY